MMQTSSFATEVHIVLRNIEEVELYTAFLRTLEHLRDTGVLPNVTPGKRVKLTQENVTGKAVQEIVREHARVFGQEQTLAALHGLGARSVDHIAADEVLAWNVYDHLFNRLQARGA